LKESQCKINYNIKTHKNRNSEVTTHKVFPSQPENPYKAIEKINNYGRITVPLIGKMISRIDSDPLDPLPCYMKVNI
jgi:hypothetical protein